MNTVISRESRKVGPDVDSWRNMWSWTVWTLSCTTNWKTLERMLYFVVNLPRGPVVGIQCTVSYTVKCGSVNPDVLQGSPMTFSGFRSDNHHIYHTTSHCSIPPNVSLLWTIPSGYYSAEVILPIHHRISLDMITQPVRTCLHISSILKPTTFVSELLDGRISFP